MAKPEWPPPPPSFFVGFDLGQKQDHSAIAVLERVLVRTGGFDHVLWIPNARPELHLRHVERLPLHTSYPVVAERLMSLCRSHQFQGYQVTLVVDATGVGAPVLDMLRKERPPAKIIPISITAGGLPTFANGVDRIPKSDLVQRLQLLIQSEQLRIPSDLPGASKLLDEVQNYRRAARRNGRLRFAPSDEASHDDLVTALMLAAWAGGKTLH